MNKKELHHFSCAEQVSYLSDYDRVRIGCVVIYKGSIISTGFNSTITHPLQCKYSYLRGFKGNEYPPQVHAEINALGKIKYKDIDWGKVKIFIFRRDKNGNLAMCRPCAACMAVIRDFEIKDVYYTQNGDYKYERVVK